MEFWVLVQLLFSIIILVNELCISKCRGLNIIKESVCIFLLALRLCFAKFLNGWRVCMNCCMFYTVLVSDFLRKTPCTHPKNQNCRIVSYYFHLLYLCSEFLPRYDDWHYAAVLFPDQGFLLEAYRGVYSRFWC